jgi:molybdate transport system substrate-binding protein
VTVASSRRSCLVVWLSALVVALGSLSGAPLAAAQATIDCPEPTSPAASPSVATPAASPAPAEEVAFPEGGGELTVFAAASLTDAFTQIADDIQAANPGISIAFTFAGSQALATQLTEGAPADVFASANTTQMQVAVDTGLITAEPEIFVQNRLALVVPADNPAGIVTPADLAGDDLSLVLANVDVPVGRYARESICAMTATYGEGFVDAVAGNIVSEEEDVRAVLTKVQVGEADAGIVYVSDVTADVAGDVAIIAIPDAVNILASYPIAPLAEGNQELAAAFIAYVLSPNGQFALDAFGFMPAK